MGNASSMDNYESADDTVLINKNLTTAEYSDIKKEEELQHELNDTPTVIDTEDDTTNNNNDNNITNIINDATNIIKDTHQIINDTEDLITKTEDLKHNVQDIIVEAVKEAEHIISNHNIIQDVKEDIKIIIEEIIFPKY